MREREKEMESKEDVSLVKMTVEQLKDSGGREASSAESSSPKDGADGDHDHNLPISRLLSQLENLREEEKNVEKLQQTDDDLKKKKKMEEPSSSLAVDDQGHKDGTENDMGIKSSRNDEIILRELREVKKQNFITHCLLSAMIVLTLTWQLSEVSLIFKLKDRINHPFRSISEMLGFRKDKESPLLKQLPAFDPKQDEDNDE